MVHLFRRNAIYKLPSLFDLGLLIRAALAAKGPGAASLLMVDCETP
jgi:hypothetical protein